MLVDDGDPHEDVLHQQLTWKESCGGALGDYSMDQGSMQSILIGAEFDGPGPWIDGGFNVAQNVELSTKFECPFKKNEYMCV